MKSLSDNLVKSRWIVANPNNKKRVIDSNELVLKKIEDERNRVARHRMNAPSNLQNDFEEGLEAKQVGTLFEDNGEEVETTNKKETAMDDIAIPDKVEIPQMIQAIAYAGPSPEELIDDAKKEIESMKKEAEEEICQMKKEAQEKAKTIGYSEGKQQAEKEYILKLKQFQVKEKQLDEAYEKRLKNMEIELVENLADIYSHVLGISMKDYGPTILHVLDEAIHETGDVKNYMIHVSKEEADMVKNNIELLKTGLSAQTEIEIIEDVTMITGNAYIETDGEIFDCSIDTQLNNLATELKALAYRKADN